MGLRNELIFTEALDQVEALCSSQSADEIQTRLEQISVVPDLAQVCMMLLLLKTKGADTTQMNGIDLANPKLGVSDLLLPPGVEL